MDKVCKFQKKKMEQFFGCLLEKQTFYDYYDHSSAPMERFEKRFFRDICARDKSNVKCKEIEKSTFNLKLLFFFCSHT